MTNPDRKEEYAALNAVVAALGWEITKSGETESPDWHCAWIEFKSPEGVPLRMTTGGWQMKGKVEASFNPVYRDYLRHNEMCPSVGFSLNKAVDKQARDITNRLLPDAKEHFERSEKARRSSENAAASRSKSEDRLIALGAVRSGRNDSLYFNGANYPWYANDLKVSYNGDTASISLSSVPIEMMERIIKVLINQN